jgi:mercuric reductase
MLAILQRSKLKKIIKMIKPKQSACCAPDSDTDSGFNSKDNTSGNNPTQVAIIGSGSAAFACAIKAAEGGALVTIFEGNEAIGGCCVNVGCVPSKILIRAAQIAKYQTSNPFDGIDNAKPSINRALLAKQQESRVAELREAKYENILHANKAINLVYGWASLQSKNTLLISHLNGEKSSFKFDKLLIASGSHQSVPDISGLSDSPYWTSDDALFAEEIPESLTVIGSSVIAVEIAQAYQRLGAQVTIIARNGLVSREDPALGKALQKTLESEGIKILIDSIVEKVSFDKSGFTLAVSNNIHRTEKLLVATGRAPNTSSLNLDKVGLDRDQFGSIKVNSRMETNIENIYAAGDCTILPKYVYVAAAAGSRAGTNMIGGDQRLNLRVLPTVIFTDPQIATVGLTEAQANYLGLEVESRTLELSNVPRSLANFDTNGFVKIVADSSTNKIVGAQIIAHNAGEMIQTIAIAITNHMTTEELANQIFPYLTMVEGLKLCAQTFKQDVSQLSCCAG